MPTYDYRCSGCGKATERVCTVAERNRQACECGAPLVKLFSPPRAKAIVFGNDRPDRFGGPREKARALREKGLIEVGDHTPERVEHYMAETRRQNEEREAEELEKLIGEKVVQELGDDLYRHDGREDDAVHETVPGDLDVSDAIESGD